MRSILFATTLSVWLAAGAITGAWGGTPTTVADTRARCLIGTLNASLLTEDAPRVQPSIRARIQTLDAKQSARSGELRSRLASTSTPSQENTFPYVCVGGGPHCAIVAQTISLKHPFLKGLVVEREAQLGHTYRSAGDFIELVASNEAAAYHLPNSPVQLETITKGRSARAEDLADVITLSFESSNTDLLLNTEVKSVLRIQPPPGQAPDPTRLFEVELDNGARVYTGQIFWGAGPGEKNFGIDLSGLPRSIPGSTVPGIEHSIEFTARSNRLVQDGKSFLAPYRGESVAVVGDGGAGGILAKAFSGAGNESLYPGGLVPKRVGDPSVVGPSEVLWIGARTKAFRGVKPVQSNLKAVVPRKSSSKLRYELHYDGSDHVDVVDHVIFATGYQPPVTPFGKLDDVSGSLNGTDQATLIAKTPLPKGDHYRDNFLVIGNCAGNLCSPNELTLTVTGNPFTIEATARRTEAAALKFVERAQKATNSRVSRLRSASPLTREERDVLMDAIAERNGWIRGKEIDQSKLNTQAGQQVTDIREYHRAVYRTRSDIKLITLENKVSKSVQASGLPQHDLAEEIARAKAEELVRDSAHWLKLGPVTDAERDALTAGIMAAQRVEGRTFGLTAAQETQKRSAFLEAYRSKLASILVKAPEASRDLELRARGFLEVCLANAMCSESLSAFTPAQRLARQKLLERAFRSPSVEINTPIGPVKLGIVDTNDSPVIAQGISDLLSASIEDATVSKGGHLPDHLVDDNFWNITRPEQVQNHWSPSGHRFVLTQDGRVLGTILIAKDKETIIYKSRWVNNTSAKDYPGFKPENYHQVVNLAVAHEARRGKLATVMLDKIDQHFQNYFNGKGLWFRADPPWHEKLIGLGFKHDASMDSFLPPDVERTAGLSHAAYNKSFKCSCGQAHAAQRGKLGRLKQWSKNMSGELGDLSPKLQYFSMTRDFPGAQASERLAKIRKRTLQLSQTRQKPSVVADAKRFVNPEDWERALKLHPDAPWEIYGSKTWSDWIEAERFARQAAQDGETLSANLLKEIHARAMKSFYFSGVERRRILRAVQERNISRERGDQLIKAIHQDKSSVYFSGIDHDQLRGSFRKDQIDDIKFIPPGGMPSWTKQRLDEFRRNPMVRVDEESVHEVSPGSFSADIRLPSGPEVERLVDESIARANAALVHAKTDQEVVRVAAVLLKDLMTIHPFQDGNGRSIRIFVDTLFLRKGLPPPLLIREREISDPLETLERLTIDGMEDYLKLKSK